METTGLDGVSVLPGSLPKHQVSSGHEISSAKCLEALENAFGTAESGEDLYFEFRMMQQQPTEKLSEFLRQLEQLLVKVVHQGGIPITYMDRARLKQVLRGATASYLMLVNLHLRERREKPPTFLQLFKEIRSEEEYEASRKKGKSLCTMHSN